MVIRRIEEVSGVDFHAHKLRHTYASMLARKVDPFTLKELMGHSSITTTQIYVHIDIEKLQGAFRPHSPLAVLAASQPDSGVAALKRKRGKPKREDP